MSVRMRRGCGSSGVGYGTGTTGCVWRSEEFDSERSLFWDLDIMQYEKKIFESFPLIAKPATWEPWGTPEKNIFFSSKKFRWGALILNPISPRPLGLQGCGFQD